MRTKTPNQAANAAAEAFREHFQYLFAKLGLSQERLADAVTRRGGSLSQKSVSNIKNLNHRSTLAAYSQVAEALGAPVWVMLIPGLDNKLLEEPALGRLVKLIQDYTHCSPEQREYIEKMAAGYAGLNRSKNNGHS